MNIKLSELNLTIETLRTVAPILNANSASIAEVQAALNTVRDNLSATPTSCEPLTFVTKLDGIIWSVHRSASGQVLVKKLDGQSDWKNICDIGSAYAGEIIKLLSYYDKQNNLSTETKNP